MIRKLAGFAGLVCAALVSPLAAQEPTPLAAQPSSGSDTSASALDQIEALEREGFRLLQAGQIEAAEAIYRDILRRHRSVRGDRDPYTIFAAIDLARVLATLGRLDEADRLYVAGLSMARQVVGDRSPDTLAALHDYAKLLSLRGELQAAADMFSVAFRLRREVLGERDGDTISSMTNYAQALEKLGMLDEAESLAQGALRGAIALYGEGDQGTLESLVTYTGVLNTLGRLEEAEPYYVEAVRISRENLGDRHPTTIMAINNYAVLLMDMFRPMEAEPFASQALEISRASLGETHRVTLVVRSTYAQTLQMLQRKEEVLPLLAQNLQVYRDTLGDRHPATLLAMNNYAGGLIEVDRPEEAEPLFAEVLQVRREVLGEAHPDTLLSIGTYAASLTYLDRDEEAEKLLAELVVLRKGALGERHPATLQTINNHGSVLAKLGRTADAEALYRDTLPIVREVFGDRSIMTLTMMRSYALALLDQGQADPALSLVRDVVAELRRRDAGLSISGLEGNAQRGRERGGQRTNERIFADALWANYSQADDASGLMQEAFTALQLASVDPASGAVTDAAAAKFASGQGLGDIVKERQELLGLWVSSEQELLEAVTGGSDRAADRAALRNRIDTIADRIAELDKRLELQAPQYFAILRQQAVEIDAFRAVLGDDEAMLFLVAGRDGTHIMAVTKETIAWDRSDRDANNIAAAVAELREGLEIRADAAFLPIFDLDLAHQLYVDLIQPVSHSLAGKSRVYVVADGALSRLPLGTLITEPPLPDADFDDPETLRSASWLADRFALVQIPSAQSLVYIRSFRIAGEPAGDATYAGFGAPILGGEARVRGARSATLRPVDAANILGEMRTGSNLPLMNPDALRRLSSLPGTRTELETVRDELGLGASRLWLSAEMTESAIRSADLSSTRILHLATHGFTSEEAGSLAEPGLVFTPPDEARADDDGYLAAFEVVGLDLSSAQWVILSACNTASPSGRPGETGLSGLAQAFFYAGAESLLVSHWPVFDDIAPRLTTEVLRRSQAGVPRADALQAAMRAIRLDPALDAAHPAVWAPFTLVGEGR